MLVIVSQTEGIQRYQAHSSGRPIEITSRYNPLVASLMPRSRLNRKSPILDIREAIDKTMKGMAVVAIRMDRGLYNFHNGGLSSGYQSVEVDSQRMGGIGNAESPLKATVNEPYYELSSHVPFNGNQEL